MSESIFPRTYRLDQKGGYGALANGFSFELREGYFTLVGRNNSGKSSILQFLFRETYRTTEIGSEKICYIHSDRDYIDANLQNGDGNLGRYNQVLFDAFLNHRTFQYNAPEGGRSELFKQIMNHQDSHKQRPKLDDLLNELGFDNLDTLRNETILFREVPIGMHGSGNRMLLPILAALTDPLLKVILIDEPERGLEPVVQKSLRDIFIRESNDKAIIVATHSHLFLNKSNLSNNYKVMAGPTIIKALEGQRDLLDVSFNMLGNSFEDLHLPGNYLIVEGSADQEICNKVLELKGVPMGRVKVLAAGGISKVSGQISAVCEVLRPVAMGDSPYSQTVVALIDKPEDNSALTSATEIAKCLNGTGRYFELDTSSLEEYLYNQNIIDEEELALVTTVEGKVKELAKTSLSKKVAARLTIDDLEKMPIIVKAVEKAIEKLEPVRN